MLKIADIFLTTSLSSQYTYNTLHKNVTKYSICFIALQNAFNSYLLMFLEGQTSSTGADMAPLFTSNLFELQWNTDFVENLVAGKFSTKGASIK